MTILRVVEASGTSEGARKGWLKRKRAVRDATVAYHGSHSGALESILREGIQPQYEPAKKVWSSNFYTGDRANAVFATRVEGAADAWGRLTAQRLKARSYVVFKVRIPPRHSPLWEDELGGEEDFYLHGGIPPKWILGYKVMVKSGYSSVTFGASLSWVEEKSVTLRAAVAKIVYVPVVILK